MKYILFFLFLFFFLCFLMRNAKNSSIKGDIESTLLVSTGNNLPFWMTHNELGKYSSTGGSWQELSESKVEGSVILTNKLNISYGIDLALLINQEEIKPEIIQAYTGLSGKIFC